MATRSLRGRCVAASGGRGGIGRRYGAVRRGEAERRAGCESKWPIEDERMIVIEDDGDTRERNRYGMVSCAGYDSVTFHAPLDVTPCASLRSGARHTPARACMLVLRVDTKWQR